MSSWNISRFMAKRFLKNFEIFQVSGPKSSSRNLMNEEMSMAMNILWGQSGLLGRRFRCGCQVIIMVQKWRTLAPFPDNVHFTNSSTIVEVESAVWSRDKAKIEGAPFLEFSLFFNRFLLKGIPRGKLAQKSPSVLGHSVACGTGAKSASLFV